MSAESLSDRRLPSFFTLGFGVYVLAGGGVTLVGWFAGILRLTDWGGDGIAMFVNTAVMATAGGAALLLQRLEKPWAPVLTRVFGLVVALIGAATLFEHLSDMDLGIDRFLVREPWGTRAAMAPGRPGPPAAVSFTVLGIALMLLTGDRKARHIVPALGVVISAVASLSLIGYLFGSDPLYAVSRFTGIAMQTATMILSLALGVIASVPERQPMRALLESSGAGDLARWALPFILGLPILLGWLRLHGQRAGYFDLSMGSSLLVIALIALLCALLWWCVAIVSGREDILRLKEESLLREIAERKRAEEALRLSAERANEASRAKDDFLAALSHELRTPLTPALLTAAALEDDPALPADLREQLAVIRRNIELEARLIDDLLDLTRVSRGKLLIRPVVTDLHELINHVQEIVGQDIRDKRIVMRIELDACEHHVHADPARFQQVLWNLLKNAIKFTPAGGDITIRTSNPATGRVAVRVEDTGIGIAPSQIDRIFLAFNQGELTGRHQFGGLGLGLSISKAIMDAHGGSLVAESAGPGKGAIFIFEIDTASALSGVPTGS
jgi:signal transduction histidine kinase